MIRLIRRFPMYTVHNQPTYSYKYIVPKGSEVNPKHPLIKP